MTDNSGDLEDEDARPYIVTLAEDLPSNEGGGDTAGNHQNQEQQLTNQVEEFHDEGGSPSGEYGFYGNSETSQGRSSGLSLMLASTGGGFRLGLLIPGSRQSTYGGDGFSSYSPDDSAMKQAMALSAIEAKPNKNKNKHISTKKKSVESESVTIKGSSLSDPSGESNNSRQMETTPERYMKQKKDPVIEHKERDSGINRETDNHGSIHAQQDHLLETPTCRQKHHMGQGEAGQDYDKKIPNLNPFQQNPKSVQNVDHTVDGKIPDSTQDVKRTQENIQSEKDPSHEMPHSPTEPPSILSYADTGAESETNTPYSAEEESWPWVSARKMGNTRLSNEVSRPPYVASQSSVPKRNKNENTFRKSSSQSSIVERTENSLSELNISPEKPVSPEKPKRTQTMPEFASSFPGDDGYKWTRKGEQSSESKSRSDFDELSGYHGNDTDPKWMTDDTALYTEMFGQTSSDRYHGNRHVHGRDEGQGHSSRSRMLDEEVWAAEGDVPTMKQEPHTGNLNHKPDF